MGLLRAVSGLNDDDNTNNTGDKMKDTSYIDKYILDTIHDRQEQIAKYLSEKTTKNITADNVRELIIPEICGEMEYTLSDTRFLTSFNIKKIDDNVGIFLSSHMLGYTIPGFEDNAHGKIAKKIDIYPLLKQEWIEFPMRPKYFRLEFFSDNKNGKVLYGEGPSIGSFNIEDDIRRQEGMQVFWTDGLVVLLNKAKAYDRKSDYPGITRTDIAFGGN